MLRRGHREAQVGVHEVSFGEVWLEVPLRCTCGENVVRRGWSEELGASVCRQGRHGRAHPGSSTRREAGTGPGSGNSGVHPWNTEPPEGPGNTRRGWSPKGNRTELQGGRVLMVGFWDSQLGWDRKRSTGFSNVGHWVGLTKLL